MKPYIMLYSETYEKKHLPDDLLKLNDTTLRTFTIESDDNDLINAGTSITKVNENSDEDYIYISMDETGVRGMGNSVKNVLHDITISTETIENNDDDYLTCGTLFTNVNESNDENFYF
ncbi:hypothetical protein DDT52_00725 [Brenneria roseae subsp. roseae]|uniref:hypothetical protein n=1 Tax=Brenneria roseae TaxID=1509241 RepID=UPI000D607EAC|nr:hypothetical protein [Brenneria roseae]PWC22827.1 hypothetical protein DDT52_00725 [Brenneria roseae subsp. roseae]